MRRFLLFMDVYGFWKEKQIEKKLKFLFHYKCSTCYMLYAVCVRSNKIERGRHPWMWWWTIYQLRTKMRFSFILSWLDLTRDFRLVLFLFNLPSGSLEMRSKSKISGQLKTKFMLTIFSVDTHVAVPPLEFLFPLLNRQQRMDNSKLKLQWWNCWWKWKKKLEKMLLEVDEGGRNNWNDEVMES